MPFTIKGKKELFVGRHLSLWQTNYLDKSGNEQTWEWVKRKNGAVIFPITNDNKVVLIKNYRVPLEKYVIECPAGLLDKENETPEDTVRRELLEETGYKVEKLFPLPLVAHASAMSDGMSYFFIGTGATRAHVADGEDTEDISVFEIPLDNLVKYYLDNPDVLFNIGIIALYQIALEMGLASPPGRRVARKS